MMTCFTGGEFFPALRLHHLNRNKVEQKKQRGEEVVERDTASGTEQEGKEISEGGKLEKEDIRNKHRREKKRDETEQIG